MSNFTLSAANVDERVDAPDARVDEPVDEAICASKSVGDTENKVAADVKACADETVAADVKACADETADVGEKTCADETPDEIDGASAILANPIGIANDELVDDNVPLAPPLHHGSCIVHGSTRTPELSTPNCREPTLVS